MKRTNEYKIALKAVQGFSLIEVLVSIFIVTAAVGILYRASGEIVSGEGYLRTKQRAYYVAMNAVGAIVPADIENGSVSGEIAGQNWAAECDPVYSVKTSSMKICLMRITVFVQGYPEKVALSFDKAFIVRFIGEGALEWVE